MTAGSHGQLVMANRRGNPLRGPQQPATTSAIEKATPSQGAGPGLTNQSQAPKDIKIEAKCLPAGNVLDTYEFNVCAHPINFRIQYEQCVNVCCGYSCEASDQGRELIGYLVNWQWDSDSGEIDDLKEKVFLDEEVKGTGAPHDSGHPVAGDHGHDESCDDLRVSAGYMNSTPYNDDHRRTMIDFVMICGRCGTINERIGRSDIWVDLDGTGGYAGTYHRDSRESGSCTRPTPCSYSWCYERLVTCPDKSMETNQCY